MQISASFCRKLNSQYTYIQFPIDFSQQPKSFSISHALIIKNVNQMYSIIPVCKSNVKPKQYAFNYDIHVFR